ncbi:MAG: phosphoribosyltransferase [Proteobacteria bacterium]|nr:phosphoribosyltransferase [Pseudomonadota bacterium]
MPFTNRVAAGRDLARALAAYKGDKPIVMALPRGGVPVAAVVATALDAPLDLILVRKIGVPFQPELAMGAVVDGPAPITIRNDDVIASCGIDAKAFDEVRRRELTEIERRRQRYLAGRPHPEVEGRTVIVVDDGIATGATTRAALQAMRERKAGKIVLAIPVAPADTIERLRGECDAIVCLESHTFFGAIGAYYADFRQVSDDEVVAMLDRAEAKAPAR